jgi:hypothetical protein
MPRICVLVTQMYICMISQALVICKERSINNASSVDAID